MSRPLLFIFSLFVITFGMGWINYPDTFYPGLLTVLAGTALFLIQLKSFILEVLSNGR